jgi:hypothetical protein
MPSPGDIVAYSGLAALKRVPVGLPHPARSGSRGFGRAGLLLLILLVCVAGVSACGAGAGAPPRADGGRLFPRPARVAVLVLENRSYEQVIGSASAPYINSLATQHALETHYYAVTHPSLPNYLALTGGSVFGIRDDCGGCDVDGSTSLVGQLDATGHTWKAYFEHLDNNRRPGHSRTCTTPTTTPSSTTRRYAASRATAPGSSASTSSAATWATASCRTSSG